MELELQMRRKTGKFVCKLDKQVVSYVELHQVEQGVFEMPHTWTDPAHRGKGYAQQVVQSAFDWALKNKYRIIPSCSYIHEKFLAEFPQYKTICID
jgi:predicted GNAT family acetyltransferase